MSNRQICYIMSSPDQTPVCADALVDLVIHTKPGTTDPSCSAARARLLHGFVWRDAAKIIGYFKFHNNVPNTRSISNRSQVACRISRIRSTKSLMMDLIYASVGLYRKYLPRAP